MACKQKRPPKSRTIAQALYVHVPLCVSKCRYCDFYSIPVDDVSVGAYVDAVAREVDRLGDRIDAPADSVFIGGGTPTVLPVVLLAKLLAALAPLAAEETEFGIEANPATVTSDIAAVLADSPVNRVSVGAQSFDATQLRTLGRTDSGPQVVQAVDRLRRAGIDNISLDLIYGICGQDVVSWQRTLEMAGSLATPHLSCYALSVEPGTPLHADVQSGRLTPVDDLTQRACYDLARQFCDAAGLEQYELSNFAAPSRPCRHNLTYWHNRPYVGIGPAAVSFLDGRRTTNLPDLQKWQAAIAADRPPPATSEHLTGRAALAEAVMLTLRLTDGADREQTRLRYGEDPVEAFQDVVERYRAQNALIVTPQHLRISPEYYFVSNTILADIVAAAGDPSVRPDPERKADHGIP